MMQEVNLISQDCNNMLESEYKINTFIFCTQDIMSQSKGSDDGNANQIIQNDQKYNNTSCLGQEIFDYQGGQFENLQTNNSQKILIVEVEDEEDQQKIEVDLFKKMSENAKSNENESQNGINHKQTFFYNNQQPEQLINKISEKKIALTLETKKENHQICKQNFLVKSNSLELSYKSHSKGLIEYDQHNTFDNGYENNQYSNSLETSVCQSPLQGEDFQHFHKQDSSSNSDGENNSYLIAQSSSKKSKFHQEFFNLEYSNSENLHQNQDTVKKQQQQQALLKSIKSSENNGLGNQHEDKNKILEILLQKNNQNKVPLNKHQRLKLYQVNKAIVSIQRLAKIHPKRIDSICQLEDDLKLFRNRSISKQNISNQQSKIQNNQDGDDVLVTKTNQEHENPTHKNYKQAFDDIRRKEKMSFLCERGSQEDIQCIKQLLESDPRKYLRDTRDPEHFLSSRNVKGLTPIYIACKNGNIDVVKFLIKSNCNYMVTSKIQKQLEETPFETALRWNHVEICKFMLEKCAFEDKFLISCLPLCSNSSLKVLIENKIQKKSNACNIF